MVVFETPKLIGAEHHPDRQETEARTNNASSAIDLIKTTDDDWSHLHSTEPSDTVQCRVCVSVVSAAAAAHSHSLTGSWLHYQHREGKTYRGDYREIGMQRGWTDQPGEF